MRTVRRSAVAVLEEGQILARDSVANLVNHYGIAGLRLIFRGDAPHIDGFETAGDTAFRHANDPGAEAARVLAGASGWVSQLVSIEIVRPSLESAYLALTGRGKSTDGEELPRVA